MSLPTRYGPRPGEGIDYHKIVKEAQKFWDDEGGRPIDPDPTEMWTTPAMPQEEPIDLLKAEVRDLRVRIDRLENIISRLLPRAV